MTPFFILGLPRSRTAWLANLFTHKHSFCFHDALSQCDRLSDLKAVMDSRPEPFVGNADSGMALFWFGAQAVFPDAKVIVVRRELSQVRHSVARLLGSDALATVDPMLAEMDERLDSIRGLTVRYEDLSKLSCATAMWEYVGLTDFDYDRFDMLTRLNITEDIATVMARSNGERFASLMETA